MIGVCKRGHEVSGANLYIHTKNGARECKRCKLETAQKWRINNRDNARRNTKKAMHKILFGGNREKAILRDGEKCLHCGMSRAAHKEQFRVDITVDHIDGRGKNTPAEHRNSVLENLQTLCLRCHGKKDSMRRKTILEKQL